MNEYYGVATTPTTDYLAHYGVKGMKWGVRKALSKGGIAAEKALARQYKKDAKHLAKLEKRAVSGKKYAKRAAALGAGAAAAGGLAVAGTAGVSKGIGYAGKAFSQGAKGAGALMQRVGGAMARRGIRGGGRISAAGQAVSGLSKHNASGVAQRVSDWGKSKSIGTNIYLKTPMKQQANINSVAKKLGYKGSVATDAVTGKKVNRGIINDISKMSNDTIARIGAGAVGAGLAGAAGYNAYRALTAKKNAERATTFRKEMNKAYAGTKYANGYKPAKKIRR
jgi:hypothetical protein